VHRSGKMWIRSGRASFSTERPSHTPFLYICGSNLMKPPPPQSLLRCRPISYHLLAHRCVCARLLTPKSDTLRLTRLTWPRIKSPFDYANLCGAAWSQIGCIIPHPFYQEVASNRGHKMSFSNMGQNTKSRLNLEFSRCHVSFRTY
jgi:hypothetical protein